MDFHLLAKDVTDNLIGDWSFVANSLKRISTERLRLK
jgi:hypothetical protein